MNPQHLLAELLLVLTFISLGRALEVKLTRLSTVYLPTYGENGTQSYPLPSLTVEQLAFHAKGKIIYGVGDGIIHIINANDVENLQVEDYVMLPDLDLTDVETCDDHVFISYRNKSSPLDGGVLVYRAYNPASQQCLQLRHNIPVGALPDMVYPTSDCVIVVAIENEGLVVDGQFYDPPGGVGIIRFPSGIEASPTVSIINFTQFDDQFNQLSKSGVRWVYRDSGNSFSNNIEPEYITFNSDYSKAYVSLQENNAIAVVDLKTDNITALYGLGFKQWGQMDPSDRDDGVHINEWPVYGIYNPDAIHWVRWNGVEYIISANEGDAQEYAAPANFTEEIRGKSIKSEDIASSVSDVVKQALQNDSRLGRLKFSSVDGKNSDGKFEKFYTYGARSISIWRASDMARVFDSGSDIEKKTAELRPDIFNSNADEKETLKSTVDTRSDDKGPETESVTTAILEGHLFIFASNERPGSIVVYSVPPGGMAPQFQTLYTENIPESAEKTWGELLNERKLFGLDMEYIQFFSASDGLADFPVLLIAGTVSGSVSVLKVDVKKPPADNDDNNNNNNSNQASISTLMVLLCSVAVVSIRPLFG